MRLVLSRAAAAPTLLAAAAVVALLTTVLMTAFVLYAQLLPVAGTRAAIIEAPADERTLRVHAPAERTPAEFAARDAAVRELFAAGLAGVPLPVSLAGHASGQELPPGLAPDDGSAVVGFLRDLPDHATLVGGDWPEPGQPDPEAALPAPVAGELGLGVGDRVEIVDTRTGDERPAALVVSGLYEPADPADPYWRLLATPIERGGWGPFVVPEPDFLDRYQLLASLEWLAAPDPARLAEAGMDDVAADVAALTDRLIAQRETEPALDDSVRFAQSGVDDLAGRLAVATVVNRSGMVLPAALLVVIAGYGLVLLARLLAAHRHGEHALLRARGASRRQLVRFTASEALLVVTPAGLLAAPAGSALVEWADRHAGAAALGLAADLDRYGVAGPPLAWIVAVAAAVGCAAALALPAAGRGGTWVAEQQARSRPRRAAAWQRAGVDVALVALAILAWSQLRQYGTAVSATEAGLGIDPVLVAAPALGVLAATAVTLRLLPLATRWGVRVAARRDGFAGLFGMWQADRRPHAGPVLLLVLAVATAVLAPAVAATWQRSQQDQAAQRVGADLRVVVANPAASSRGELAAAIPASARAMPVHRASVGLGERDRATLLAVDSEQVPEIARLRPDLARTTPAELFATLRQDRPELAGMPLPEGARRVVGALRFTAPDPGTARFLETVRLPSGEEESVPVRRELPEPRSDRPTVYFLDDSGIVRSVQVGQRRTDEFGALAPAGGIELDEDGRLAIDVAVPRGATTLLGLGAGMRVSVWDQWLTPDGRADPVPVTWHWEGLRVVGSGGAETPLEVPADWEIRTSGEPEPEPIAGEPAAASVTLQPFADYPTSIRFLITAPVPSLSEIPALATPDVLAAAGVEIGQTIRLDGPSGLSTLRVAGVIEAVPGTADGSGIIVDLPWLSAHQYLWERPTPDPTEWWLSTPDGSGAAPVASLDWTGTVFDRRAEARSLLNEPLGVGLLVSLWAAAAGAALLAAFGLVVDSRATAVRRRRELAVLHTLGTPPPALARALVAEQAVLAGLGVAAGVLVGLGVAAAMGSSLILTPAGEVPVPAPLLTISPVQLAVPTVGLFAVAVALGGLVARRARREVAAGALRIGED